MKKATLWYWMRTRYEYVIPMAMALLGLGYTLPDIVLHGMYGSLVGVAIMLAVVVLLVLGARKHRQHVRRTMAYPVHAAEAQWARQGHTWLNEQPYHRSRQQALQFAHDFPHLQPEGWFRAIDTTTGNFFQSAYHTGPVRWEWHSNTHHVIPFA